MSNKCLSFLLGSFLFSNEYVETQYSTYQDREIIAELQRYREYVLSEIDDIRAEIKNTKDKLNVCIESFNTMPTEDVYKQLVLYMDQVVIPDPLFELTEGKSDLTNIVGEYIGFKREDSYDREKLIDTINYIKCITPLIQSKFVVMLPISLMHEAPQNIAINYSPTAFSDVIPESILKYYQSIVKVYNLEKCSNGFRMDPNKPLYPGTQIYVDFPDEIPLKLEENLRVILKHSEVFSDNLLKTDPSFGPKYYFARKTLENVDFTYFPEISKYIDSEKCSFFVDLYGYLIKNGTLPADESAIDKLKSQLTDIENALVESRISATTTNIAVIGALAYYKLTNQSKYRGFLSWIKKNNVGKVEKLHIEDVINLYDEIYEHVPKKIFLARWYPSAENDGADETARAESRVNAIKEVATELGLSITDLGTRDTGTFDIRKVMYDDIKDCDIFIADLSGSRHNVMIEVGYALKHVGTGRMAFYFQKGANCTAVPFDVNHLAYDEIVDSSEIKTKTKGRILKILEQAKNGEI